MKYAVIVAAVMIGLSLTLTSAKPVPTGTIAIAAGYTPALGEDLLFDYTENLHNNQSPRIQIVCFQDVDLDGDVDDLVYGEARDAEVGSSTNSQPFAPLGGGSSLWQTRRGAAECEATLYYWRWHPIQELIPLATISFTAGG